MGWRWGGRRGRKGWGGEVVGREWNGEGWKQKGWSLKRKSSDRHSARRLSWCIPFRATNH